MSAMRAPSQRSRIPATWTEEELG
uniref:Uncharacterized protein n=1 Tax=Anguilla anguilla TaxID=7936 RepID=A0A0E9UNA1_ANGAN